VQQRGSPSRQKLGMGKVCRGGESSQEVRGTLFAVRFVRSTEKTGALPREEKVRFWKADKNENAEDQGRQKKPAGKSGRAPLRPPGKGLLLYEGKMGTGSQTKTTGFEKEDRGREKNERRGREETLLGWCGSSEGGGEEGRKRA